MVVNTIAPKAQVNAAATPQTTGMVAGNSNRGAVRVPAQAPAARPVTRQAYAPVRTVAPEYHPVRFIAQTATADKTATATATPENPHVSAQQGGQSGISNASQSAHVQVTPRGVYQQTTTTQNGQTTQSSSFTPAQNASQGATTNPNVGRTNPYVNTQLPQDAQNSEKNTTIQVDHSKLDNDIAQAKKDGVQVTHTADDQPIVVHSQNEAHDYEDQVSQEYNNEDQAIIKADNIQKAYNADKSAADAANQQIQQAGKDAASQGVTVDTSKTQTIDFSGHTPSLQDAQTMRGQIQSLTQNELNQIKQAEAKYKQEVQQAQAQLNQAVSGNVKENITSYVYHEGNNSGGTTVNDWTVDGVPAVCGQPNALGPNGGGNDTQISPLGDSGLPNVTMNADSNLSKDNTLLGLFYYGNHGPADITGGGAKGAEATHLALAYYVYAHNIDGVADFEKKNDGITDAIANNWKNAPGVQQLLAKAATFDPNKLGVMGMVYHGAVSPDPHNKQSIAFAKKYGTQQLFGAKFTKRPPHIPLQVKLIGVKTPTVKANYHYMSAKLGNTDTQTGGSAMPNININVSANANAKAKAKANANANVNVNANAKGNGNANANGNAKGCGMSRGHGCGAGAATGTGAGCGMGSGYGNCGMVESVPACGGYGAVDTGAGYGAGVVSPLVATGAVSGQGAVSMPVAAAGNGVGAGNGAGEGVAMPATGQKNGSVLTDLAAVAAAIVGGSMLLKKRNA